MSKRTWRFGIALAGVGLLCALLAASLTAGISRSGAPSRSASSTAGTPWPAPTGVEGRATAPTTNSVRDAAARAPMPTAAASAAKPGPAATTQGPNIVIPPGTTRDQIGVRAGYPHTAEGAVGQLTAIERAVFEQGSLDHAQQVYTAWSVPGAVPAEHWGVRRELDRLLQLYFSGAAQVPQWGLVQFFPAAGQIKSSDGPDWVIACTLVQVRVSAHGQERFAFGFCQRMTWAEGRWRLDAGEPAAAAPSTWPGTSAAYACGWRDWIDGHEETHHA